MPERPRPVLDQVNLVVGDMGASVAVYRLLGIDVEDTVAPWQQHHRSSSAGVDLDFDSTSFARQWNGGSTGGGVVIGFRFGSRHEVDEAFARLTGAGHRAQQAPVDAFWGARFAVVEDPDGNAVALMSAMDHSMRSEAPDPGPISRSR